MLGYFVAVIFGSLTIYYVWNDYRKEKMSKQLLSGDVWFQS